MELQHAFPRNVEGIGRLVPSYAQPRRDGRPIALDATSQALNLLLEIAGFTVPEFAHEYGMHIESVKTALFNPHDLPEATLDKLDGAMDHLEGRVAHICAQRDAWRS